MRRASHPSWLLGGAIAAILGVPVAWSSACSPNSFACTTAIDCVSSTGTQGVCETGFCAYADSTCPATHERYSVSAGSGLANACVPADAGPIDAAFDPDAGVSVPSCSACSPGEVCAATTAGSASGSATFMCWPIPAACAVDVTCPCAYQLCGLCSCRGVTDAGVQCECPPQ